MAARAHGPDSRRERGVSKNTTIFTDLRTGKQTVYQAQDTENPFNSHIAKLKSTIDDDDDVLALAERDGGQVLLGCATVKAIGTKIEGPQLMWKRMKLIFTLEVIEGVFGISLKECTGRRSSVSVNATEP
jgi:hypothetical protein